MRGRFRYAETVFPVCKETDKLAHVNCSEFRVLNLREDNLSQGSLLLRMELRSNPAMLSVVRGAVVRLTERLGGPNQNAVRSFAQSTRRSPTSSGITDRWAGLSKHLAGFAMRGGLPA